MADLTPSQRKRLAKVSSEAFEAMRQERAQTLRQLQSEGVSLRVMARELGVSHPMVVQWMAHAPATRE